MLRGYKFLVLIGQSSIIVRKQQAFPWEPKAIRVAPRSVSTAKMILDSLLAGVLLSDYCAKLELRANNPGE